jgi:hypothetical protein
MKLTPQDIHDIADAMAKARMLDYVGIGPAPDPNNFIDEWVKGLPRPEDFARNDIERARIKRLVKGRK